MTDLYRPITLTRNFQANTLASLVESDPPLLCNNNRPGDPLSLKGRGVRQREKVIAWDGQEAAVERAFEISVVGTDGVVDRDEVSAGGESALDHELSQGCDDGRQNVAAAQQRLADGHEFCDAVVAITNQL